jgi:hypothetical protein
MVFVPLFDIILAGVAASESTILVTVALLAAAFAIAFLLPRHARAHAPAVA